MPLQTVDGAQLACTFGSSPSSLVVLPVNRTDATTPSATIMDSVPMLNIQPFGMCMSPSNPQVAAATAAALGVLTPQPCLPATQAPWSPGMANVLISEVPALDSLSTCTCLWAGVITITDAGQQTTQWT